MRFRKTIWAFIAVLVATITFTVNGVSAQETVWVTDESGHLTQDTIDNYTYLNEELLPQFDLQPEIAVEVLQELPEGYDTIDDYKTDRFGKLGVGSKEHDSGLLYVLVLEDRQFAMEVGYGLEHIITDLESSYINNKTIEDLKLYSETGDPEYLNTVVNQVGGELLQVIELQDSGDLEQYREQIANQQQNKGFDLNWMQWTFIIIVVILVSMGSVVGGGGGYYGGGYSGGSSSGRSSGGSFGGGRSGGGGSSGGW